MGQRSCLCVCMFCTLYTQLLECLLCRRCASRRSASEKSLRREADTSRPNSQDPGIMNARIARHESEDEVIPGNTASTIMSTPILSYLHALRTEGVSHWISPSFTNNADDTKSIKERPHLQHNCCEASALPSTWCYPSWYL